MQKQPSLIAFTVIVILAALGFAGWRMWGSDNAVGGYPELDGGVYAEPISQGGLKYLVPPDEIYASGLAANDRPALQAPKHDDIASADSRLADELEGMAVSVGGVDRFYPFQILNWHQIVHDDINGQNLIITYSPLTGSAVVYSAKASETTGELHNFVDAGHVYNNSLLMEDGYGTWWNQTTGQAIVGKSVGQKLEIYPSAVMTWATWKDRHPTGLVLSMDTGVARDYGRHPYASYESSPGIFFPLNHVFDKLEPKDIVYRLDTSDQPLVFMRRYLPMQTDPNAVIGQADGEQSVVAFYDEDLDTARVFERSVNGRTLTFNYDGGTLTDVETGSRWSPEGVALSGELRGTALVEVPVTRHYAFAHFAMYPNSLISGAELLPTDVVEPEGQVLEVQ